MIIFSEWIRQVNLIFVVLFFKRKNGQKMRKRRIHVDQMNFTDVI